MANSPDPATMRKMHRIPGAIPNPEPSAPIYGTYPDAKMQGADYDVKCAAWGDSETPTDVSITNGMGRKE